MSLFLYIREFTLLCLILVPAFSATAHVSADMPDPIAEVEYQMILDFEPDDLLTRYKLAMVYYRLNKDDQAKSELQNVLKKNNNYFLALEGLGMLLVRQKKYDAAVIPLKKAANHEKRDSGTYFYLGKAFLGVGRPDEAMQSLTKGLKICQNESEKMRPISIKQFEDLLLTIQQDNQQAEHKIKR